jgi:hypothetical protein
MCRTKTSKSPHAFAMCSIRTNLLKQENEKIDSRTNNIRASGAYRWSRLVIGTSRTVGSAKKFVRITSGFGGGEFTKTLRKICTCQKLKFSFLLLEYCKITKVGQKRSHTTSSKKKWCFPIIFKVVANHHRVKFYRLWFTDDILWTRSKIADRCGMTWATFTQ